MPNFVGQHREASLSLPMVALAIVAAAIIYHQLNGHPGGDPNGIILGELSPVVSAVPQKAVVLHRYGFEPMWQRACPDNPYGKSGWWLVEAGVEFKSGLPPTTVVSDVGTALRARGWRSYWPNPDSWVFAIGAYDMLYDRLHLTAFNTSQMPPNDTPNWTKHLPSGKAVDAALVRISDYDWFLGASAEPPGFAVSGC